VGLGSSRKDRYTIFLFVGNAEISWELSRNVLQGVTNADSVVMQNQVVCEEVMRSMHGYLPLKIL
jgi:hypothetical protein